jgi:hypothetical protein
MLQRVVMYLLITAPVGSYSRSWKSLCTITQSSLQRSHLLGLRVVMYRVKDLPLPWR